MDWYVRGQDPRALTELRHRIRDYLTRHGEPGGGLSDAELVVQELLANAAEHAGGSFWVRLSWGTREPQLEVWDLGPGFEPGFEPAGATGDRTDALDLTELEDLPDLEAEGGRGLFLVTHLATAFELRARQGGGTRAVAQLPVRRAPALDVGAGSAAGPRTALVGVLPDLAEADALGGFGRESFLRALVVQLAQRIEFTDGPAASEAAVSEVGLAVGGQMEAAFRTAEQLASALTPEQLAACFVRLKAAIDGRFRAIEIGADRIVLVNTRCPFGDAVRRSPALCRMTSSVFGGIAARNHPDGAAVVLEERIAVGDPGCRVVVHLGAPLAEAAPFAHRYAPPATAAAVEPAP